MILVYYRNPPSLIFPNIKYSQYIVRYHYAEYSLLEGVEGVEPKRTGIIYHDSQGLEYIGSCRILRIHHN